MQIPEAFVEYVRATSPLELVAVVLAIAYVILAIRASAWCWPLAFTSSALYVFVFAGAHLYMDATLNIFFAAMTVYGWYEWRHGGPNRGALPIARARPSIHITTLAVIAVLTVISGAVLGRYTDQAWPYVDSFIAWASVATTWLAARKLIENWLYWIAIDAVAVPVYINRGLRVTAALFAVYVILAIVGWLSWQRAYRTRRQLA